jgi:hypothetical protein
MILRVPYIALAFWLTYLVMPSIQFTVTLFPQNRQGGQQTLYTVYVIKGSVPYSELNSTVASITLKFPAQYTLPSSGLSCKFESAASPCSNVGANTIAVATPITGSNLNSVSLEIGLITNPSVETGSVQFTVSMVDLLLPELGCGRPGNDSEYSHLRR